MLFTRLLSLAASIDFQPEDRLCDNRPGSLKIGHGIINLHIIWCRALGHLGDKAEGLLIRTQRINPLAHLSGRRDAITLKMSISK